MNLDQVRFVLQYRKLKNYLCGSLDYTPQSAAGAIAKLRRMEPDIMRMFLRWFRTDELPETPINGVRLRDVMERHSMNPVAAFLALNWLRVDPSAAKYALSRPTDTVEVTDSDKALLIRIAKERGWTLPKDPGEDVSDIEEPR